MATLVRRSSLMASLVAAAEEERFNRIKHSAGFPDRRAALCGRRLREQSLARFASWPWREIPGRAFLRKAWHGLRMPSNAASRLRAQGAFATIEDAVAEALGK